MIGTKGQMRIARGDNARTQQVTIQEFRNGKLTKSWMSMHYCLMTTAFRAYLVEDIPLQHLYTALGSVIQMTQVDIVQLARLTF